MKEQMIEAHQWRYATKMYNPLRKISTDDLETLLESVRMSVSSMGLQPYRVLVVQDDKIREQLRAAAWNQNAITDSSHLFVFAVDTSANQSQIGNYLENIGRTRTISLDSLDGFKNMMHTIVDGRGENR